MRPCSYDLRQFLRALLLRRSKEELLVVEPVADRADKVFFDVLLAQLLVREVDLFRNVLGEVGSAREAGRMKAESALDAVDRPGHLTTEDDSFCAEKTQKRHPPFSLKAKIMSVF